MTNHETHEPKDQLVKAFSAGAVVNFRPNLFKRVETYNSIVEGYQKLKEMIAAEYPQVEVEMLDIAPGSAGRKEALADQLEEAGVISDAKIIEQAQSILNMVAEEDPEAVWAAETADPAPQHK